MKTEQDILKWLDEQKTISIGPVRLRVEFPEQALEQYRAEAILILDAGVVSRKEYRFSVEIKATATPKTLQSAIQQARRCAEQTNMLPLVIVPYLSERRLADLQEAQCCGIDLCGNGVLIADGLFVYKAGQKNRYPQSTRLRKVYRGKGSLVPRALLIQNEFQAAKELVEFINAREASISFSMISKVLKVMEEDLTVSRETVIRCIQPDKILDSLRRDYVKPEVKNRWLGRREGGILPDTLFRLAQGMGKRLTLTGTASASQYCVYGGEPVISVYTTAPISKLLEVGGLRVEEGKRFANLEIIQTDSDWAYFDSRIIEDVPTASPIQTWLELTNGDTRQQKAAEQIRAKILSEMVIETESP